MMQRDPNPPKLQTTPPYRYGGLTFKTLSALDKHLEGVVDCLVVGCAPARPGQPGRSAGGLGG